MIIFGKSHGTPPPAGTWVHGRSGDAVVHCPNCGHRNRIPGSNIEVTGPTPIVLNFVCEGVDCGVSDGITLEHWEPAV